MSYQHIRQLAIVRSEYKAARASADYILRAWPALANESEFQEIPFPQVRGMANNIGDTYIVRLFAEFEVILRAYLPPPPGRADRRRAEYLINRLALRHRIPVGIRDAVHDVRVYRNQLAHNRPGMARVLTFPNASAALNRFLAPLF